MRILPKLLIGRPCRFLVPLLLAGSSEQGFLFQLAPGAAPSEDLLFGWSLMGLVLYLKSFLC